MFAPKDIKSVFTPSSFEPKSMLPYTSPNCLVPKALEQIQPRHPKVFRIHLYRKSISILLHRIPVLFQNTPSCQVSLSLQVSFAVKFLSTSALRSSSCQRMPTFWKPIIIPTKQYTCTPPYPQFLESLLI